MIYKQRFISNFLTLVTLFLSLKFMRCLYFILSVPTKYIQYLKSYLRFQLYFFEILTQFEIQWPNWLIIQFHDIGANIFYRYVGSCRICKSFFKKSSLTIFQATLSLFTNPCGLCYCAFFKCLWIFKEIIFRNYLFLKKNSCSRTISGPLMRNLNLGLECF